MTVETAAAAQEAADIWDRRATAAVEGYFAAHPTFAAGSGRHEFDGLLPDWSRQGMESETRRLSELRRTLSACDPALLDASRRRDRELLLTQIESDLFWLEETVWPVANPHFYAGALDPGLYVCRDYAPPAARAAAYVRMARQVPTAVAQIRANLQPPLPPTYIDLGASTFDGLATFYRTDVPALFAAAIDDPSLLAAVHAAGATAGAALSELAAWFAAARRDSRAQPEPRPRRGPRNGEGGPDGAGGDFRLGADGLARMLQATERIDLPLARIAAAGRDDLERNLAALAEACGRYQGGNGHGAGADRIAACMARVQAAKPADGPVAAARRQLGHLRRFVEERALVSIPGDEEAWVAEAPPHQRWNSAYIEIPGPYDRHLPSIYYIAPPDPSWSEAERAAYLPGEADLLFVSAHEVWPGHFLQFLHSNRAPSEISRLFIGYAFAEGWAHYSEEMLWEAGFGNGDPELHIGQLQNALLRNVRLLVSIGLHTGEMSLEAAEAMFREHAFQAPASARQQAARGTFDPAYLNYTLGKLIVRRLRQDWLAAAPGRTWRGFHDQLLSFGGPPLPLARAAMLAEDQAGSAGAML
jgi:hypothetical protein